MLKINIIYSKIYTHLYALFAHRHTMNHGLWHCNNKKLTKIKCKKKSCNAISLSVCLCWWVCVVYCVCAFILWLCSLVMMVQCAVRFDNIKCTNTDSVSSSVWKMFYTSIVKGINCNGKGDRWRAGAWHLKVISLTFLYIIFHFVVFC